MQKFFPFLNWLPLVKKTWKDDLFAGLTVTVIVIPQAVAFSFIAGLPPEFGLYSAIIMPVIAALFGSSNQLVSGPTTALSILVFAMVSKLVDLDPAHLDYTSAFIGLAITLSFVAGLFQILMGVLKMARLANFVSHSVIIGFTAGAGVLIAFKQMNFVFGLSIPKGSSFIEISKYVMQHFSETNWPVFAVAMFTLISAMIIKKLKYINKFYMLLAIILGGVLAFLLGGEANGIPNVGQIPSMLPVFNLPHLSLDTLVLIGPSALILALLGVVESVAIAKAIALKTHQKLDLDQEFIGQGFANVTTSLFSGYAGAGSFTRTGINFDAGAKTPLAALFSSVFLVVILLFGSKLSNFLPLASMGGIILLVAYNLIDFKHISRILKSSKKEAFVFASTFLSVLFLNLEYALLIGVIVSLYFYLDKTSNVHISILGMSEKRRFINTARPDAHKLCPQLSIIRIDGSIYFGTIERLRTYFAEMYDAGNKYVLIVAPGINFIDLAGAEWLSYEMKKFRANGGEVVIVGAKIVSQKILRTGGFIDEIGADSFYDNNSNAIAHIYKYLDKTICEGCTIKAFNECNSSHLQLP